MILYHDFTWVEAKMAIFGHGTSNLPSGYVKIAIEHGPVEIVDFPIENDDFP